MSETLPAKGDNNAIKATQQETKSHSKIEDLFALFCGLSMISFSLHMYEEAGLIMGATIGIAMVLFKLTSLSFGLVYWIVNIPFYLIGYRQFGWSMVWRTLVTVSLLSVAIDLQTSLLQHINFKDLHPLNTAIMGGVVMSIGVLVLIRHGASLGGTNLLAIAIQDRFKISAGTVGVIVDGLILLSAYFVAGSSVKLLVCSVIGLIVFNLTLKLNHKEGRYKA